MIIHPLIVLLVVIAVFALCRLVVGQLNHARIRRYIASRGSRVVSIAWRPFGAGWFGERDSIIYMVRFRERDGVVREAQCKTGMFSGVYFTNESVLFPSPNESLPEGEDDRPGESGANGSRDGATTFDENRRLREENRKLREELERLRSYIDAP